MSKPEQGKVYALTSTGPCIAKGNSWEQSEVQSNLTVLNRAIDVVEKRILDLLIVPHTEDNPEYWPLVAAKATLKDVVKYF
jgi:hypothetical protein